MKNFISRFRAELLDADIDLQTCDAALKGPGAFSVASRVTGSRMAVAVVFGIPALYLAFRALGSKGKLIGLLAIVFCPILVGVAILLGFVIAEKSFDRPNDRATKSIRLFSLRSEEAIALPPNGTITISSRWNTSGDYMRIEYLTGVEGLDGFAFTTLKISKRVWSSRHSWQVFSITELVTTLNRNTRSDWSRWYVCERTSQ